MSDTQQRSCLTAGINQRPVARTAWPSLVDTEDLFPERIFADLSPDARVKLKNFLLHNEGIEEQVIDLASTDE
jgi:hypothetical protein